MEVVPNNSLSPRQPDLGSRRRRRVDKTRWRQTRHYLPPLDVEMIRRRLLLDPDPAALRNRGARASAVQHKRRPSRPLRRTGDAASGLFGRVRRGKGIGSLRRSSRTSCSHQISGVIVLPKRAGQRQPQTFEKLGRAGEIGEVVPASLSVLSCGGGAHDCQRMITP